MNRLPYITAVISAAGRGSRMGFPRNKLMICLEGQTILERTLHQLEACAMIRAFVIVIRPDDKEQVEAEILPRVFPKEDRPIVLVTGGETREDSTWQGINAAPKETQVILYHDGARPFVKPVTVGQTIQTLLENPVDGAICVVPVKDTIKMVDNRGFVETTPQRSSLFAVQTPQVFWKKSLLAAYKKARSEHISTTDDSQIVEIFGGTIRTVTGDYENIKITTRDDLTLGQMIIRKREQGND